jgi:hypothetical protein
MSRSEDSIDITATLTVLDALMASRRPLTCALRRRGWDDRVLENAPTTIVLRACMTDCFPLKALQGDLKAIRDARLRRVDEYGLISASGRNYTEDREEAQCNCKEEAHAFAPFVELNHS